MKTTKNKNLVVFNTPTDFDLSVFDNIKGKQKYHKTLFLIHQINLFTNSDGVFRIYKKAYYQLLGLSPHELNDLLNLLIDLNLIEHVYKGNTFTNRLSEYRFLVPFAPESGIKHQYDAEEDKCPEFIKKLIADEWKVLPTEKSSYVRVVKEEIKSKSDSNLVSQLQKENEQLKAKITALEALISVSVSSPVNEEIIDPTPLFAQSVKVPDPDVVFEDLDVLELKLKTKTYYFMGYSIIKDMVIDDDDEAILLNKLMGFKDGDKQCLIYNNRNVKLNKVQVGNEVMVQLEA